MHRITLNIDLDANDLLEKEVVEAIKAETKRITRERVDAIIGDTIAQVIDNRMMQWKRMDWVTESKLKKIVDDRVQESLKSFDFGIDKNKVEEMLETRLKVVEALAKNKLDDISTIVKLEISKRTMEYFNKYAYDALVKVIDKEMNKNES